MNADPNLPVEVFRAPAKKPCLERALVLQARGLPHQVTGHRGQFSLLVPALHAGEALEELAEYGEENVGWPPPRTAPAILSSGRGVAATWAVVLTLIHPAAMSGIAGRDIWTPGKLVAARVIDGEWWRVVTALTLHGGVGHLVSNLVSGAAFLVLASHTLGGGLALLGTLLAGALGNLLNAWIQHPTHSAIGASTAVFGTLGLLASYEWVRRHALGLGPLRRWAPLMAGAALLGYLGMGGDPASPQAQRTDVVAHVTGFLAGVLIGFVTGHLRLPDRLGRRGQVLCTVLSAALVVLAWSIALTR